MSRFQSRLIVFFLAFQIVKHEPVVGQANPLGKSAADIHTLNTELRSFYDISSLPFYLNATEMAQISSYDTTGGNDDGFNGKFSYLRKNPDGSLVLADLKGPGVINRIWTPTPTEDTLDFFIDDDTRPALSIAFIDLFSGKTFPFISPLCGNQLGGYYCYFPILFQKNCRIIDRGKKIQFHQIQYRLFASDVIVEKFDPRLNYLEKLSLNRISMLWNNTSRKMQDFLPSTFNSPFEKNASFDLTPGETRTLFSLETGGRILGLEFFWNGPNPWNKNIDLKISWDNEKLPAIYCPLEDFFGFAFGKPSMQSLLLGTQKQFAYCYFPMPFNQNAKIELVYREGLPEHDPIPVKAKIYYSNAKRLPASEGRFFASWASHSWIAGDGPHIFLKTAGKGHYVGSILQASGSRPGMTYFFEGDDSTAIDGVLKIHGTGSEDYFNGGWYALMDRWDTKMSLPIHGALDYSLPFCRTGGYRLYLNDKISFAKSIFQSIEHGPVNNSIPASYTSLAFYYCDSPPASLQKPTNELTELRVPDTLVIYPQLMQYKTEGDIHVKTAWAYNTGGESFVYTISGESWISISLEEIPEGKYKMILDYAQTPDGCEFSVWKRQTPLTEWISAKNENRKRIEALDLGALEIGSLAKSITFRFKATEHQNGFFLNRIILVKQN